MPTQPKAAVYFFGNYHADPRNEAYHGKGWTEWDLIRASKPRYPGHRQPFVPAGGYYDEADPAEMKKQIDLAADHGVGAFIFDWYWYNDGPFLQRPLDEAFLHAPNRNRLEFAIMWANHDWRDIFPCPASQHGNVQTLYPGAVTMETWKVIVDRLVNVYFAQPNYLRIDGEPYFSFFDLKKFIDSCGSMSATADALRHLRDIAKAHGHPGVHIAGMAGFIGNTVGSSDEPALSLPDLVKRLGLSSLTDYNWVFHYDISRHGTFPVDDYLNAARVNEAAWPAIAKSISVPYHPNVTVGWDVTPRCDQSEPFENHGYPWTPVIENNTPANLEHFLRQAKLFAAEHGAPLVTINAWNEWTEGSYLLPDTFNGMGYLDAMRRVFGKDKESSDPSSV